MYRCKECQAEYKDKVEYCDCGNNTFDYIADLPQTKTETKKTFVKTDSLKTKGEIVSIAFFVICIILSILIWAFAGNTVSEEKKPKTSVSKQQVTNKNIPNIDKIWDNTPLYQPVQQTQSLEQQSEVTTRIIEQKPVTPTPAENLRPVKNPPKKIQPPPKQQPKQKNTQVTPKVPPTPTQVSQPKPKTIIPEYNPNDPELLKYKNLLRAALFSKFAVGSIQGSGSCVIEFSINRQTGKLENRTFVQKSDNKALNDAVYYMLMSVPKYNVPPASYHGEKIRMKFYINNGNYEISFI